jgi:hypothetical protein
MAYLSTWRAESERQAKKMPAPPEKTKQKPTDKESVLFIRCKNFF